MIARYHVVRSGPGWGVKRPGKRRATRLFDDPASAVEWALVRAKEVIVHRPDGTIGEVRRTAK